MRRRHFALAAQQRDNPYERASDMEGEWLTYAEAAERLNTTPEAVRQKAIRPRWREKCIEVLFIDE